MANYFVLQNPVKRAKSAGYYSIPGLRNSVGVVGKPLAPTAVSIEAGILEWIITDNPFNQDWITKHYSQLNKLEAGSELKVAGPGPIEIEPEVVEAEIVEEVEEEPKRLSPKKIKSLKVEISKQLVELGIDAPKNSSLPDLENLLSKETNQASE